VTVHSLRALDGRAQLASVTLIAVTCLSLGACSSGHGRATSPTSSRPDINIGCSDVVIVRRVNDDPGAVTDHHHDARGAPSRAGLLVGRLAASRATCVVLVGMR
jgi:hypothetical protein